MTIAGISTVYKVYQSGNGRKHSGQPRHESSAAFDEHGGDDKQSAPAVSSARPATAGDRIDEGPVRNTIDVSA